MKKKVAIGLMALLFTNATFADSYDLKKAGMPLNYVDESGDKHSIVITRDVSDECKDKTKLNGGNPEHIWSGDYALESVPKSCKKTFVTTIGKISPMKIADGIETYGELEVLDYMKKQETDQNLLLIDSRMRGWYLQGTIPGAINISFKSFDPANQDFEIVMDTAGVEYDEGVYNFENAKTLLLFCNGVWCPQSTWAIENLLKIGYPKEKLIWYRGGMYSWKMVNLTTIKPY